MQSHTHRRSPANRPRRDSTRSNAHSPRTIAVLAGFLAPLLAISAVEAQQAAPRPAPAEASPLAFDDPDRPHAIIDRVPDAPPIILPIDDKPIGNVKADIDVRRIDDEGHALELPRNIAAEAFAAQPPLDPWTPREAVWVECSLCSYPATFHHQPLYFEDANLERCGIAHGCWQPFCSVAHFLGNIPILPYKIGAQHPRELVCATPDCPFGCRYGCTRNFLGPTVPTCSAKGFLAQGLATTGLVFLIP